jgi:hypothetical protein
LCFICTIFYANIEALTLHRMMGPFWRAVYGILTLLSIERGSSYNFDWLYLPNLSFSTQLYAYEYSFFKLDHEFIPYTEFYLEYVKCNLVPIEGRAWERGCFKYWVPICSWSTSLIQATASLSWCMQSSGEHVYRCSFGSIIHRCIFPIVSYWHLSKFQP